MLQLISCEQKWGSHFPEEWLRISPCVTMLILLSVTGSGCSDSLHAWAKPPADSHKMQHEQGASLWGLGGMCCKLLRFGESRIIYREGNGSPLQYSCLENPMDGGAWWAAVHGVAKSRTQLNDFTFTFHFHALEKEMATHSSVLAWRIPVGLLSMGSHSVQHDWSNLAAAAAPAGKTTEYKLGVIPS